jgi:enamine deaminase RidA (YjgF/YER057c/UK114 family)
MRQLALLSLLAGALTLIAWPAQKKKKGEDVTQALEFPKEPPAVLITEAEHLVFQVTPSFSRGLLSQQLRECLRWLLRQDRAIVRLRAFVAGTGDTRRVQAMVGEVFGERHVPLPTLTVLQIGGLPVDGAQVVLEAVEADRKPVNPNGLLFVAGRPSTVEQPLQPVAPLAEKAIAQVSRLFQRAGIDPEDVLALTCYLTSVGDVDQLRGLAGRSFPKAAVNFVQSLRGALQTGAVCEAVARRPTAAAEARPLDFRESAGTAAAVLVGPGRLAFTGAQLAFGKSEEAARLAWQRLGKTLEQVQLSPASTVLVHIYPLSRTMGELAQKTGAAFFDPAHPPAVTVLPFEGLPSMDASFSADLIAVMPETQ